MEMCPEKPKAEVFASREGAQLEEEIKLLKDNASLCHLFLQIQQIGKAQGISFQMAIFVPPPVLLVSCIVTLHEKSRPVRPCAPIQTTESETVIMSKQRQARRSQLLQ